MRWVPIIAVVVVLVAVGRWPQRAGAGGSLDGARGALPQLRAIPGASKDLLRLRREER